LLIDAIKRKRKIRGRERSSEKKRTMLDFVLKKLVLERKRGEIK